MKKKKIQEKKESLFSKKRTLTYLMGGFIILLMAASALNMWKGEKEEVYDYNGLKFLKTDQGLWVAYRGEQQIVLSYSPEELEKIDMPSNVNILNYAQKIYISTDDIKANARAMDYFKRKIGITQLKPYACTEDKEGCEDLPLRGCENATQGQPVVIFKKAEEKIEEKTEEEEEEEKPVEEDLVEEEKKEEIKISYEENCLVMEGTSEDLTKAIDKLYFIVMGI